MAAREAIVPEYFLPRSYESSYVLTSYAYTCCSSIARDMVRWRVVRRRNPSDSAIHLHVSQSSDWLRDFRR